MQAVQMTVEDIKEIILAFPEEDKMQLLKELEKDMINTRLDSLLDDLKDVPLAYDEISEEVEYVREKRYRR